MLLQKQPSVPIAERLQQVLAYINPNLELLFEGSLQNIHFFLLTAQRRSIIFQ
jgi:hypothetical protein